MICFVISANNHIKRISRSVETLCQRYGTQLEGKDGHFNAFPTPEQLSAASVTELRTLCNTGYRDRYIKAIAEKIAATASEWEDTTRWSFTELRTRLMELPGVGAKVADCIALFGFGRWEAFPIDTWVRRIMIDCYFPGCLPGDHTIRELAINRFGKLAGLAQQYLFEAARQKNPDQPTPK